MSGPTDVARTFVTLLPPAAGSEPADAGRVGKRPRGRTTGLMRVQGRGSPTRGRAEACTLACSRRPIISWYPSGWFTRPSQESRIETLPPNNVSPTPCRVPRRPIVQFAPGTGRALRKVPGRAAQFSTPRSPIVKGG